MVLAGQIDFRFTCMENAWWDKLGIENFVRSGQLLSKQEGERTLKQIGPFHLHNFS